MVGGIKNQTSATTRAHLKGCSQRRCSPRLKDIPQSKRPYYGTSRKVVGQQQQHYDDHHSCDDEQDADSNLNHAIKFNDVDAHGESTIHTSSDCVGQRYLRNGICETAAGRDSMNNSGSSTSVDHTSSAVNEAAESPCNHVEPSNDNFSQSYKSLPSFGGQSSCALVKDTIRTFNPYHLRRRFQGEQIIGNKQEVNVQNNARDLNQAGFLTKGCTLVPLPKLHGVLCTDLSGGQEEIGIPVINLVDNMPFAVTGFTYSRSTQVAENVDLPPNVDGCSCKGNCMHPKNCACARLNNSKFPYVRHNGGRLRKAKDVVFECGPNCGCGPDCINRITQKGIKYQLEVFRTLNKGWGVRTKDFIPCGAPVCEYVGILRRTDELDNVDVNDYIFEIDCLHTIKGIEGRERRFGAVSVSLCDHMDKMDDGYLEKTPEFCIDANSIGNVSRFINHSCDPNLFVQCILSAHHDVRLARIVLFAASSISPWQELTYDYGYPVDSVIGPDGKVKVQPCYCGTEDCRKRLY